LLLFVCTRTTLPCRIGLGEQPIVGFSNQSKAQTFLELRHASARARILRVPEGYTTRTTEWGSPVDRGCSAFSERALRCMCWRPVGHVYLLSVRVNTYHITHTVWFRYFGTVQYTVHCTVHFSTFQYSTAVQYSCTVQCTQYRRSTFPVRNQYCTHYDFGTWHRIIHF